MNGFMLKIMKKTAYVIILLSFTCCLHALSFSITGNLLQLGQTYYRYNAINQLVISNNRMHNISAQYQYFANGLRANETIKQNDQQNTLYSYYNQHNERLNIVGQGMDKMAGFLLVKGTQLRFAQRPLLLLYNRHHSVITAVGIFTTNAYQYNAYGKTLLDHSIMHVPTLQTLNLHYAGYMYDWANGNDYLYSRYYDPTAHIFLSRDSKDLANHYFYANNRPNMMRDPNGHDAIKDNQPLWWLPAPIMLGTGISTLAILKLTEKDKTFHLDTPEYLDFLAKQRDLARLDLQQIFINHSASCFRKINSMLNDLLNNTILPENLETMLDSFGLIYDPFLTTQIPDDYLPFVYLKKLKTQKKPLTYEESASMEQKTKWIKSMHNDLWKIHVSYKSHIKAFNTALQEKSFDDLFVESWLNKLKV